MSVRHARRAIASSRRASRSSVLFCALIVAACGGGNADESTNGAKDQGSEPVTIRVASGTTEQVQFEAVIEQFQKAHPNIKVKGEWVPLDTYGSVLATQFQAGNGPDVFKGNPGSGATGATLLYGKDGHLADLSDLPGVENFVPEGFRPLLGNENELWGIMAGVTVAGVGYNADLFAEYKLQPPTTFAQLLDICQTISSKGEHIPIALAGGTPILLSVFSSLMLSANNVYAQQPDWNTLRSGGKATFANTPGWKKAFTDVQRMQDAKCFSPGVEGVDGASRDTQFAKGEAVMMTAGVEQFANVFAAAPDLPLKMFPLPADNPDDTKAFLAGPAIMVNAKSDPEKQQAAKEFVSFLMRPETAKLWAEKSSTISPVDWKEGTLPPLAAPFQELITAGKVEPFPNITWPAAVLPEFGTLTTGLFTGQTSVDSILKGLDTAWDSAEGS